MTDIFINLLIVAIMAASLGLFYNKTLSNNMIFERLGLYLDCMSKLPNKNLLNQLWLHRNTLHLDENQLRINKILTDYLLENKVNLRRFNLDNYQLIRDYRQIFHGAGYIPSLLKFVAYPLGACKYCNTVYITEILFFTFNECGLIELHWGFSFIAIGLSYVVLSLFSNIKIN